jgi:WXXGXW repeat (2 copies)
MYDHQPYVERENRIGATLKTLPGPIQCGPVSAAPAFPDKFNDVALEFCPVTWRPIDRSEHRQNDVKNMKSAKVNLLAGLIAVAATGCAERQVTYVPAYQTQPATFYQPQPAYQYPQQTAYQPPPGQAVPDANAPAQQALPAQAAPASTAVVNLPPPQPQVEAVPVAPGPDYYWVPGYWGWNGGVWIWIRGNWVVRPWHGAVWVGGGWVRHGRSYVWIRGHWR